MLKINGLKKQYDSFSLECSLQAPSGRITGLVGQNGAGKSTTFKAVLGLISLDGGTILIFGKDSRSLTVETGRIWALFIKLRLQRLSRRKRSAAHPKKSI